MSLDPKRGRIVGQLVHPEAAAPKRKQNRHPTDRPRPPVSAHDIIEISSDEDEKSQPLPKRVPLNRVGSRSKANEPDYPALLSQKEREIEKLKKRENELKLVVTKQKSEIEARKGIPKVDEIEEELTCDVCALRMWAPYRLTECGHVFCLDCLMNWFDSAHARFVESHPGYTPPPPELRAVLRRPFDFPQECVRAYSYLLQFPRPHYTCPSCRAAVTRRPIEDLKIKALVSLLTSTQGTKPPEPRMQPGKGDTVFDGYSLL